MTKETLMDQNKKIPSLFCVLVGADVTLVLLRCLAPVSYPDHFENRSSLISHLCVLS